MKLQKILASCLVFALLLAGCGTAPAGQPQPAPGQVAPTMPSYEGATEIVLSDSGITMDGAPVSTDSTAAVYTANDIIYYESGKDFIYGEGSEADAHTPEQAAAHTVVHISKPGVYSLSGQLSLGQIAVDLGEDAKEDPSAVVTLVLSGVNITCQVAPAVIFYNVYECGSTEEESATKDVDTSAAGANVIIADDTVNNVNGAYVAKIYKPESVVLNGDNTQVVESKKLHKYDGAFYSKRSMNIYGNTGVLNIQAENEGLDSELHLTINGGQINIRSGNDGINTNEDNISVTTVNGGKLSILVSGQTGEGDGIDSNGWLVINGGTVIAQACSNSADAGIDSDKGIHITGGTVIATGHMLDQIENGGQTYAVFTFAQKQQGGETVTLKNAEGKALLETTPENAYSILIFTSPDLQPGTYTLWSNDTQLAGSTGGMGGGRPGGNGQRPGNKLPTGGQRPQKEDRSQENAAEGSTAPQPPEGTRPQWSEEELAEKFGDDWAEKLSGDWDEKFGGNRPELPGSNRPETDGDQGIPQEASSPEFTIREGGNMFSGITAYTQS